MTIDPETMLVAKLAALEDTREGRMVRALLDELRRAGPGYAKGKEYPPCDCGGGHPDGTSGHEPRCSSHFPWDHHVELARFEWLRANELAGALRALVDGVAGEVAFHPGAHDRTAPAFEEARRVLSTREESKHPGDYILPF